MPRKKSKHNGGAPTNEMKREWASLYETKLFDRDSELYAAIEESFENLSSSKMFEAFSRLCMIRDDRILVAISSTDFSVEASISPEVHMWMLSEEKRIAYIETPDPLVALKDINIHFYHTYLHLLESKKLVDLQADESMMKPTNKGFSIDIDYVIKLKHIYDGYDVVRQDEIAQEIAAFEIGQNYRLRELDNQYGNEVSRKMVALALIPEFKVPIQYIKQEGHLLYLENFEEDNYKDDIYKTMEDKMSVFSTTTVHSPKLHTIRVNPKKPSIYYEELFEQLQISLSVDTKDINKTYKTVVSHNSKQKHLAGKLVDLLYIYDSRLFGFSISRTLEQLTTYWRHKKPDYWKNRNNPHYLVSRSTYHKYQKIITDFIDNKYYEL